MVRCLHRGSRRRRANSWRHAVAPQDGAGTLHRAGDGKDIIGAAERATCTDGLHFQEQPDNAEVPRDLQRLSGAQPTGETAIEGGARAGESANGTVSSGQATGYAEGPLPGMCFGIL